MGESSNPDWMNQWQAIARQYMGAWQDAMRTPAAASPFAMPSPGDGFEQWSRLFVAGAGGQSDTVDRVIDSIKSYAGFLQSMVAAASANAQGNGMPWTDALRQGFTAPGMNALFEHPMARAWRMPGGQGDGGFAQFANLFGSMPKPPADAEGLKAWLSLPAFGVMREHQEHYQKMAVAWVDYQEQLRRYSELMMKASQRGFELFEGKLTDREQPGRQIESLRALYDLWVDAAEEGYAEIALSKEFRDAYGALVNAQMRVRSQLQQEVERVSVDLGMPTRTELNSIGERLQALRREVRGRGRTVDDNLADEVAVLREEFADLKAAMKRVRSDVPGTSAVETPEERPVARAKHVRRARVVAKPAVVAASKKQKRSAKPKREVDEATAPPSKNFASRIAKFANASLGTSRAKSHRPEKRADAPKKNKKKH